MTIRVLVYVVQELALPLKMYLQKFPRRQELHAYESALLELTLGQGKYEEVTALSTSSNFNARNAQIFKPQEFSRFYLKIVDLFCVS